MNLSIQSVQSVQSVLSTNSVQFVRFICEEKPGSELHRTLREAVKMAETMQPELSNDIQVSFIHNDTPFLVNKESNPFRLLLLFFLVKYNKEKVIVLGPESEPFTEEEKNILMKFPHLRVFTEEELDQLADVLSS